MNSVQLFHQLVTVSADRAPNSVALQHKNEQLTYQQLVNNIERFSLSLTSGDFSINPLERVAIYLPKQFESVIAIFATSLAGGTFVPVNPLLKPKQVEYLLNDCQTSVLITSLNRYKSLKSVVNNLPSIKRIILTNCPPNMCPEGCIRWEDILTQFNNNYKQFETTLDESKMAAILYTSGSTGQPKGVVLSHKNLVEGAKSVASYLKNTSDDKLLAVLPFSFDYGLSQLTTSFLSGASVVLLEYLLPMDVPKAVAKYSITGLAAVPPLWIQLSHLDWPAEAKTSLRYITNTGGAMPKATLKELQRNLPNTTPFLMYGLTEAFRSTYLDPVEIENRPNSIGKAIPNAEIFVLNEQGNICQTDEEGELVHHGVHVALGYWQSEQKTEEKFRPLPVQLHEQYGDKPAVWSGDKVKKDNDGFIYFIGRNDEMIKSSGYRISPAEIEELLYQDVEIDEVAAIGLPHPSLGHAIFVVIKASNPSEFDQTTLIKFCKANLPNYMQPHAIELVDSLPRNPNGKINRTLLCEQYSNLFIN